MNKFNFRIKDFEARTTGDMLLDIEPHVKVEIVKWLSKDHCYTIAIFDKKDGWDVRLLGDRVINEDFSIIGKLIKLSLEELNDKENENE